MKSIRSGGLPVAGVAVGFGHVAMSPISSHEASSCGAAPFVLVCVCGCPGLWPLTVCGVGVGDAPLCVCVGDAPCCVGVDVGVCWTHATVESKAVYGAAGERELQSAVGPLALPVGMLGLDPPTDMLGLEPPTGLEPELPTGWPPGAAACGAGGVLDVSPTGEACVDEELDLCPVDATPPPRAHTVMQSLHSRGSGTRSGTFVGSALASSCAFWYMVLHFPSLW